MARELVLRPLPVRAGESEASRVFIAAGPVFVGIGVYFYGGYRVEVAGFANRGGDGDGEGGGVYG